MISPISMYFQGFIGGGWREAILFIGGIREKEKKIIEERERRNAIYCTCRCHAHLSPLTKFSDCHKEGGHSHIIQAPCTEL